MTHRNKIRGFTAALIVYLALTLVGGCSLLDSVHRPEKAPTTTAKGDPSMLAEEDLPVEESLTLLPQWMAQADSLWSQGDSTGAESAMMQSILTLQSLLRDVPQDARRSMLDTLSRWSHQYEDRFGSVVGDLVATEEGLREFVGDEADSLAPDELLEDLAIDSFQVVRDTTIHGWQVLPAIPDTMNARVARMIEYFTENPRGRKWMGIWLERGGAMIPRMTPILHEHGMPEDLVYLAMIESGFRTNARSYAHAVGPWQFIYSTGKMFGLESDWWYDERSDPELATAAAAAYLRQLHEHLGHWYLALAAYNCGEGRVRREIRRSNSRDFWELNRLPRQTRNYVPTYLAARKIATDPQQYGFKPISLQQVPERDTVYVTEAIDMEALAEALKLDLETLREMNPAVLRWCTPPNRESTAIYLPDGARPDDFATVLAAIPPAKRTSWVRHRVQHGEALSTIARNYNVTMRAIMDVPENRLANPHRIRAGKHLLIPVGPESARPDWYGGTVHDGQGEKSTYRVRRGDTLSEIAERHGVGLSRLLAWNNLSSRSVIRPGQRLTVYGSRATASSRSDIQPLKDGEFREYTVRRGDTPIGIAKAHGVSLDELLGWNSLNRRSRIYPGQVLAVGEKEDEGAAEGDSQLASSDGSASDDSASAAPGALPHPVFGPSGALSDGSGEAAGPQDGHNGDKMSDYTVRRGDNVWTIARRYGLDVNEVLRANKLTGRSRIHPGDRLKLPIAPKAASEVDESEETYQVQRGDTLWDIAQRFDVSIRELKNWNNLSGNRIRPGDRLVVYTKGAAP